MIVSHSHRFIFIKTEKTGGTSVEIALSKYLDGRDVITPIAERDERIRRNLGYPGPRNFLVPFRKYRPWDWARLLIRRRRLGFVNHSGAAYARRILGRGVWESYFRFCFERDPWDKAVSWYFNCHPRAPRPSLQEFIRSGRAAQVRGLDLYSIDGRVAVDRVCRFENLDAEMVEVARIVGLPEVPSLPRAKGGIRTDRRHYSEVLGEEDRERIAVQFGREIELMGYEWTTGAGVSEKG